MPHSIQQREVSLQSPGGFIDAVTDGLNAEIDEIPRRSLSPLDTDEQVTPISGLHVDYFSFEWQEEDLHMTWKFSRKYKDTMFNSRRLENASWRRWMQNKFHLAKLDPQQLNWKKDTDVACLWGPIYKVKEVDQQPTIVEPRNWKSYMTRSKSASDFHAIQSKKSPLLTTSSKPRMENLTKNASSTKLANMDRTDIRHKRSLEATDAKTSQPKRSTSSQRAAFSWPAPASASPIPTKSKAKPRSKRQEEVKFDIFGDERMSDDE